MESVPQTRPAAPSWGSRLRVVARLGAWLLELVLQGFSLLAFLVRRRTIRARFHRLILENGEDDGTLAGTSGTADPKDAREREKRES